MECAESHPLLRRTRLRLPPPRAGQASQLALCKLCDLTDWTDSSFRELAAQVMGGGVPEHRKLWEFTQLIRSLERLNLLQEGAVGLSVAAGCERVLYYLANRIGRIIATDLYGDGAFSGLEASNAMLEDPARHAPYPYRKQNLAALYMNGCALDFADESFDFAFCLSSIEHFGGFRQAQLCIREMGRVVRPGGLVFFTTECSLNGYTTDEVFRPAQIEGLLNRAALQLVDPIDWRLSDQTLSNLIDMRTDDLATLPHVNLKHLSSVFTSISIAARKAGSGPRRSTIEQIDSVVTELRSRPIERPAPKPRSLIERVIKKLYIAKWKIEDRLISSAGSATR